MQVTYPSHHSWKRKVEGEPSQHFSPRTAGKIKTALALCAESGVTYHIAQLDEAFLTQFVPLYTEQIGSKNNAVIHDVYASTLGKTEKPFPYLCLSIFEQGEFIGGTIFSLRPDRISFAYRTFNTTWKQANLKITPAYIAEYVLAKFAIEHKLSFISHGKDRNPYGFGAGIGLAIFKLSAGCRATVAEKSEIKTIDTAAFTEDVLILAMPPAGEAVITKAYLVTTSENEYKYLQVTKYPDLLEVEVLYRY